MAFDTYASKHHEMIVINGFIQINTANVLIYVDLVFLRLGIR